MRRIKSQCSCRVKVGVIVVTLIFISCKALSQSTTSGNKLARLNKLMANWMRLKTEVADKRERSEAMRLSVVGKNAQNLQINLHHPHHNQRSLLRQALDREAQLNCVTNLLCSMGHAVEPSENTNTVNDYAFVVKELANFFGFDEYDSEEKKDDEEVVSSESSLEQSDEDDSSSRADLIATQVEEGESQETIKITTLPPLPVENSTEGEHPKVTIVKKVTLQELIGDIELSSDEIKNHSSARVLAMPKGYIGYKLHQIQKEKDESRKLRVARQLLNRLTKFRRCLKNPQSEAPVEQVSSTLLSTCPLTSEVIRYLATNLNNGTSVPLNASPLTDPVNSGFVITQTNQNYAQVISPNSPLLANTRPATDLKNPTLPGFYPVKNSPFLPKVEHPTETPHHKLKPNLKSKPKETESNEYESQSDSSSESEETNFDFEDLEPQSIPFDDELDDLRTSFNLSQRPLNPFTSPFNPNVDLVKVYGVPQPSFNSQFETIATNFGGNKIIADDYFYDEYKHQREENSKKEKPKKSIKKKKKKTPTVALFQALNLQHPQWLQEPVKNDDIGYEIVGNHTFGSSNTKSTDSDLKENQDSNNSNYESSESETLESYSYEDELDDEPFPFASPFNQNPSGYYDRPFRPPGPPRPPPNFRNAAASSKKFHHLSHNPSNTKLHSSGSNPRLSTHAFSSRFLFLKPKYLLKLNYVDNTRKVPAQIKI